jgi:hypothetical protein
LTDHKRAEVPLKTVGVDYQIQESNHSQFFKGS